MHPTYIFTAKCENGDFYIYMRYIFLVNYDRFFVSKTKQGCLCKCDSLYQVEGILSPCVCVSKHHGVCFR